MDEIAAIAVRLASMAGLPLLERLALLLGLAVAVFVLGKLGTLHMPPAPAPTDSTNDVPTPPDKPDATWGQNDGPPGGGMEGG